MSSTNVKIVNAYRNSCIPAQYLSSAKEALLMFRNQVCVDIDAMSNGYFTRYEVEDIVRATLTARMFTWIKENHEIGPWSIISHSVDEHSAETSMDYHCVIGVLFANPEDAERFMSHFLLLEKLTN